MQRSGGAVLTQATLFVFASLLLVGFAVIPAEASADTISTQTAQVIPPGGNSCAPLSASNLTPYVYEKALHSFEFTVPDASYVAVLGSVGNTGIPFNQITRWGAPNGAVKMHVDIATTPIGGILPLSVTLLSSRGAGQPVCVTTVSMTVQLPASSAGPVSGAPSAPAGGTAYAPSAPDTEKSGTGKSTTGTSGASASKGTTKTGGTSTAVATRTSTSTRGTAAAAGPFLASLQKAAQKACATPQAAQRTWLVLLLVYAIIVGAALWAEYPMSLPQMRTPERVAIIILILLLLLLGFWYFSATCRTAFWMPLTAVLVAVLGLLAAYRNHPRVAQLLQINQETKTP